MDKDGYHDYGAAPIKGEGQIVSYETVQRTPDEMIAYLRDQLMDARKDQAKYRRVKRLARNKMLMVANNEGFVLVEDMDEYLRSKPANGPLTREEILRMGMEQLEEAFDKAEAENGINPRS
jgi:hypothetical protein